jgi:hypothetical protein
VSWGVPEGLTVSAPHVTPVIVLLNLTNIIWYRNRVGHQYVKINTNSINKTLPPSIAKQMEVKMNQTSFIRRNR